MNNQFQVMENDMDQRNNLVRVLIQEAFGDKESGIIYSSECRAGLNYERRRFIVLSSIGELERNIKYFNYWNKLSELSLLTVKANSCDELFPIVQEIVTLIQLVGQQN